MPAKRSFGGLMAEAVVIVASILLAFAIQAWWDEAQQEEDSTRLLISIQAENLNNIQAIERDDVYRSKVREAILQMAEMTKAPEQVDPKELDKLISMTVWYQSGARLRWASLDAFVDGGHLTLIDDDELREQLATLHAYKSQYQTLNKGEEEHLNRDITPFLTRNASLPQIVNHQERFPGSDAAYPTVIFPIPETTDHRPLLANSEFIGLLSWKLLHMQDAVSTNRRFLAAAQQTGALLSQFVGQGAKE
jgi:hypothetical protein